jgi:hypothetical protein
VGIAESRSDAAFSRSGKERLGKIDAVHVEPGVGEQVRVPPLSARDVEQPRAKREPEDVEDPGDFLAVALRGEERLVLVEVSLVEERQPPLVRA